MKRENDFEELESLRHETNLLKKLKKGKLSVEQFSEKMKAIEGNLFEEGDFSLKSLLKKKKVWLYICDNFITRIYVGNTHIE